jgi:hypothetical protein
MPVGSVLFTALPYQFSEHTLQDMLGNMFEHRLAATVTIRLRLKPRRGHQHSKRKQKSRDESLAFSITHASPPENDSERSELPANPGEAT